MSENSCIYAEKIRIKIYTILLISISIISFSGCGVFSKKVTIDNVVTKTDIELQRKLEEWTEQLYSNDPTVRSSAAVSLLGLNLLHAQEPLVKILRNNGEREDVQISVINAFGFTKDDRATDILIDLLDSESAPIQTAAAESLEKLKTRNSIRKMSETMLDPKQSISVKLLLAKSLGNTNDRDAVDPLIKTLSMDDIRLRQVAMESLEKITKQPNMNDSAWWREWWTRNRSKTREQWLEDIVSKQEENTQQLESKIEELNFEIAQKFIKLLEVRSDKMDPKPLIEAMESDYPNVRIFAAKELVKIKEPSVINALIHAISDEQKEVRIEVVQALGEIDNDDRVIKPLIQSLSDTSLAVRKEAAKALGKLGKREAEEDLILALNNNTDISLICSIIESLGQIGDTRAVDPLITFLGHKEPKARECTAAALGKIRDARAMEPLIAALNDEQERVRWYAADGLGKIGDPLCVESLIKLLSDPSARVRESAVTALGQIGNQQSIESLLKALQDVDKRVADQAAESLLNIKKIDFEVMDSIATTFSTNKDYKRAEIILERQIAEYSTKPEFKEEILQAKIKLAKTLFTMKDLQKALGIYEELVKQFPDDDTIKIHLIQCLKEMKQFDRALEWYTIWIKETSRNNQLCWQGRLDIANAMFEQGKYENVKSLIDGLQVEDPNLGGSEFKQNFQSLKDVSVRELFNSKTVSQKSELEESLNVENKK
ncbi:MAG: HEAT repeat domain-containing protein [Candidatus Jettenia caeni]|nr:MAG: HEAT repeat domain-containing protein [Candidatus Jettenia caeni]